MNKNVLWLTGNFCAAAAGFDAGLTYGLGVGLTVFIVICILVDIRRELTK